MTTYKDELTIDFGSVGYVNSREPFKVRLDSSALTALIQAATDARRVYELFLIDRPGDIWDYISVVVDLAPARIIDRIQYERKKLGGPHEDKYLSNEMRVPFTVFDKMFYWAWDDTEPADEAWLNHRDSKAMRNFANQLLGMVRAAQGQLGWNDHLLRHIVTNFKAGTHPYSFLERKAAIAKSTSEKAAEPEHTAKFYMKLGELLRDTELVSIAYRANGDYKLLRMLATEQRRRASRTQHLPGHAMHISAIVNRKTDNVAWDSEIWFFDEGLGHGDLLIQGMGSVGGASIKALLEVHRRICPGRYILSIQDEGDLEDFDKTSDEGWFLYTRRHPVDRRTGLEAIEWRRSSKLGPVLAFSESGGTLFDFDKTLLVVGEDVDSQARETLATSMAEWEAKGGDPVLIVFGDKVAFELAGCRRVFIPPDATVPDQGKVAWLSDLICIERPWIDAIISFDAPRWIDVELNRRVKDMERPWKPWVVCSQASTELQGSLMIDGDLSKALRDARLRAISLRSISL